MGDTGIQGGAIVAVGCDHAGYPLKSALWPMLSGGGYHVVDMGVESPHRSSNYAHYAHKVASHVALGKAWRGVLLCGSGIGMCMTANRYKGVRAVCCHAMMDARLARQHNDANIITLGARLVGVDVAKACLHEFLTQAFEGGRHCERIDSIDSLRM
ncbi:MAG: ribose 5-phosphate isomerase B [Alphaproteobacteria bacterium GM7ARS4]|nr:ribose 5-phosphate isomerase B [Alphaproteobacteria bacterium GM7ARS4]